MIRPSIIKTAEKPSESPQPTVIGTGGSSPAQPAPVKPSVIGVPKSEGAVVPTVMAVPAAPAKEEVQKPAHVPAGPTKMVGKERNRIAVTLEDLKGHFAGIADDLLEQVLQFVLETDVDVLKNTSALLWQMDLQKRYSDRVMQLLETTQNESIAKANSHVSRIVQILEAIDLRGVCTYEKDGMLSRFFKSSNKEFDTPEELLHAEKELKQLTSLLGGQLQGLLQLQSTLQSLNLEVKAIGQEIKAAALAAQYLSGYLLRQGSQKISDQLIERSMSLTQTQLQIEANEPAREIQMEIPMRLITVIQHAILVMIPDWLGSVSAIRSMLEMNKHVTVTEVEELTDQKKKILKQLN